MDYYRLSTRETRTTVEVNYEVIYVMVTCMKFISGGISGAGSNSRRWHDVTWAYTHGMFLRLAGTVDCISQLWLWSDLLTRSFCTPINDDDHDDTVMMMMMMMMMMIK